LQDPVHAWSGGLDGALLVYDFNMGREAVVGMHNEAIRYVEM